MRSSDVIVGFSYVFIHRLKNLFIASTDTGTRTFRPGDGLCGKSGMTGVGGKGGAGFGGIGFTGVGIGLTGVGGGKGAGLGGRLIGLKGFSPNEQSG